MIDALRRMAVFAAVVRHGSMSAAARALGTTPSAVSQQVRALERDAGVTLLHRSTRSLRLSEAGERFHAECEAMVGAAERAQRHLAAARDAPVGELRLAAPVGFARHLGPALAPLLAEHPRLSLRVLVDDAMIDLVGARVDLAVRFGRLPDSRWVARRLGAFSLWVVAAPAYLARHGMPETPQALGAHQWLAMATQAAPARAGAAAGFDLALDGPGGRTVIERTPRITSNNQLSLQQMAVAGLGLALLGRLDIDDDLRAGRLVRVLPAWEAPALDVWAVTPQRDARPAKVRHALQALAGYLAALPGVSVASAQAEAPPRARSRAN